MRAASAGSRPAAASCCHASSNGENAFVSGITDIAIEMGATCPKFLLHSTLSSKRVEVLASNHLGLAQHVALDNVLGYRHVLGRTDASPHRARVVVRSTAGLPFSWGIGNRRA